MIFKNIQSIDQKRQRIKSCLQIQGSLKLLQSQKLHTHRYHFINCMLNITGLFLQKFDSLLNQFIFAKIEKSQEKSGKKSIQAPPISQIPKNKWERLLQKRQRKNQLKQEKQSKKEQALSRVENRRAQSKSCRQYRQDLFMSVEKIKDEEYCQLQELGIKMDNIKNSFNLPYYVQFSNASQLDHTTLRIVYNQVFSEAWGGIFQNEEFQTFTRNESIQILNGRMSIFPQAFKKTYSKWSSEKFISRLNEQLSSHEVVPVICKNICENGDEIQYILKKLRKAKIFRYELNIQVKGLLGRYLELTGKSKQISLDKQFLEQALPIMQQEFESTDIGLFFPELFVDDRQQKEIIEYWSYLSMMNQFKHSHYSFNKVKIIQKLWISYSTPFTVIHYLNYLTKFQNRIIIFEEERSYESIQDVKHRLAKVKRKFQTTSRRLQVVRDGKSSIRKLEEPQPQFTRSTSLRLFAKWRSYEAEDGLSMSSIITRLISKEIKSYQDAFCLLLRDYDIQMAIPRRKYVAQMNRLISDYEDMAKDLQNDESSYGRFVKNTGFSTPERSITPHQPQTPRKPKNAQFGNWASNSQSQSKSDSSQSSGSQEGPEDNSVQQINGISQAQQDKSNSVSLKQSIPVIREKNGVINIDCSESQEEQIIEGNLNDESSNEIPAIQIVEDIEQQHVNMAPIEGLEFNILQEELSSNDSSYQQFNQLDDQDAILIDE